MKVLEDNIGEDLDKLVFGDTKGTINKRNH